MLSDHHRALLGRSGISDEVATERGYFSVHTKAAMGELGFGASQRRAPALIIPIWNVYGEPCGYQARPDDPREVRGRLVKYETPTKQPNRIDVPPKIQGYLDDPSVPLIITEGSRKADSAVSRGFVAVSIAGVWSWRGTNGKGGKVVLPDWGALALNDRQVILCFDSDVMSKGSIYEAFLGLSTFLESRKAKVWYSYLPGEENGAKVGLDDWLSADSERGWVSFLSTCEEKLRPLNELPREDTFEDVEEETGALLLSDICSVLTEYVSLSREEQAHLITLWLLHSHCLDGTDVSPNLYFRSPMKGSGKTRALEVAELLVPRPLRSVNMSAATVYRAIEASQPTLLIDEVDRFLGKNADDYIIGILNASFRKGETVMRVVGDKANMEVKAFHVFAGLLMAGLGSLPDTLMHRSLVITMQRKAPGVSVSPFRFKDVEERLAPLRRRMAAWSYRNVKQLGEAWPEMPASVTDRAADKVEPLLAIADRAGGPWPERARAGAVWHTAVESVDDVDQNLGMRLIVDMADTWPKGKERWLSSHAYIALRMIDESPWLEVGKSGLTVHRLARLLAPFGIKSSQPSHHGNEGMGYWLRDMVNIWRQYGVNYPEWTDPYLSSLLADKASQAAEASRTPSEQEEWREGLRNDDASPNLPSESDSEGKLCGKDEDIAKLPSESAAQSPSWEGRELGKLRNGEGESDCVLGGRKIESEEHVDRDVDYAREPVNGVDGPADIDSYLGHRFSKEEGS